MMEDNKRLDNMGLSKHLKHEKGEIFSCIELEDEE